MNRAVLFDFDGTLISSLEDIADSMNQVLGEFGCPPHPYEAYRYFVGDGMEALVRRALPESHRDDATVARMLPRMRECYAAQSFPKSRPYAGIPELLDTLTAAGLTLAIYSNKPQEHLEVMAKELLGRWDWVEILGAGPELPRKPHPAGALWVAERTGIPNWDWVYLGDTDTDMRTAVGAGMFPVGVLWGFRTASELRAAGAQLLLGSPLELLPHLGIPPKD